MVIHFNKHTIDDGPREREPEPVGHLALVCIVVEFVNLRKLPYVKSLGIIEVERLYTVFRHLHHEMAALSIPLPGCSVSFVALSPTAIATSTFMASVGNGFDGIAGALLAIADCEGATSGG